MNLNRSSLCACAVDVPTLRPFPQEWKCPRSRPRPAWPAPQIGPVCKADVVAAFEALITGGGIAPGECEQNRSHRVTLESFASAIERSKIPIVVGFCTRLRRWPWGKPGAPSLWKCPQNLAFKAIVDIFLEVASTHGFECRQSRVDGRTWIRGVQITTAVHATDGELEALCNRADQLLAASLRRFTIASCALALRRTRTDTQTPDLKKAHELVLAECCEGKHNHDRLLKHNRECCRNEYRATASLVCPRHSKANFLLVAQVVSPDAVGVAGSVNQFRAPSPTQPKPTPTCGAASLHSLGDSWSLLAQWPSLQLLPPTPLT